MKEITPAVKNNKSVVIIKLLPIADYKYTYITFLPGDYCEEVIPDPIPNSEVKLFSADGTLP